MEHIFAENIYGTKGGVLLYELIKAQKAINMEKGVIVDDVIRDNGKLEIEGSVISLEDEIKYHKVLLPLERKEGSGKKHCLDMDNATHSCGKHTFRNVEYCHHLLALYGFIVLNSEKVRQEHNLTDIEITSRWRRIPKYMIEFVDGIESLDAGLRYELFSRFVEEKVGNKSKIKLENNL